GVDVGLWFFSQRIVFDVAGNADDLQRRTVPTRLNVLTDRVRIWPEASRHRFVDDSDWPHARLRVTRIEISPAQQRNPHRREVVRPNSVVGYGEKRVAIRRNV